MSASRLQRAQRRSGSLAQTIAGALFSLCVIVMAGCGGSADAPPPMESVLAPTPVAPQITTQPVDMTVPVPAAATFTAAASGTPAPTVQWQRSNDGGTTWTAIAGATGTTYVTPATTAADNGALFRAVFQNAAGSATSDVARLTVVTATSTGLSLVAGSIGGAGNLDGPKAGARFNRPTGIAIDLQGNLYVADTGNQTIRKISIDGTVSTLAGQAGVVGGDDGPAAAATFSSPRGVAVDPAGVVYVADWGGATVRKITPDGMVSTLAGSFNQRDRRDATGSQARFAHPYGITIDPSGIIYVTDQLFAFDNIDTGPTIRAITADGDVSTFVHNTDGTPYGVVARANGDLYFDSIQAADVEGNGLVAAIRSSVMEITSLVRNPVAGQSAGSTDGPGASAQFNFANGLAIDAAGVLYAADSCSNTIRRIVVDPNQVAPAFSGQVTTLAGAVLPTDDPTECSSLANITDGTGPSAVFDNPTGLVVDAAGNVYVVDSTASVIRRVTPQGVVTTFAGAPFQIGSTDGPGTTATFSFHGLSGLTPLGGTAIDTVGNVFVADTLNLEIRKISTDGQVSTFAGSSLVFGDTDGTGTAASFALPVGICVDATGNLYVADPNGGVIRKITPAGVVSTLAGTAPNVGSADGTGAAASFAVPMGVAVDAAGNVFVADVQNHAIRKITPAGLVSTLAGSAAVTGSADGTGPAASFTSPIGVAVDSSGDVYVVDNGNQTIRKVTASGVVTTLAGTANQTGSADGTGASARFRNPTSIAVDAAGNVYVADTGNDTVRKITPAGVVSTLIGVAGAQGVRLGVDARLDNPYGLSINGNQLVLISVGAVLRYALP